MTAHTEHRRDTSRSLALHVPGGTMAVEVHEGGAETVLLLHGIPGSRATWDGVIAYLSPEFTLIVPDLLGFGESSEPGGDFHAQGQALALSSMLDQLGVRSAHVVGFDFGGPIAVGLYAAAPDRVRTLSLIASNCFTDTPIPGPLKLAPYPLLGRLFFALAFGRPGLVGMWAAATRQRQRFPLHAYWRSIASGKSVRWTRRIFYESMRDLQGRYGVVQRTLGMVRVPALVVWAGQDVFFPVHEGERLAAALSGADLVVIPATGHFVPMEQPEALARALLALLRRSRGNAGDLVASLAPERAGSP